jgi:hypothetical protein
VLARLQQVPGVRSSVSDVSGQVFLIDLEPDTAPADVQSAAAAALGREARRLTRAELQSQIGPPTRGELWIGPDDLRTLSYIEGRMVAVRVASIVGAQLALDGPGTERLAEAVREEMFAHVERIHAGEVPSGRFFEAWQDIARRVVDRCADGSSNADALRTALISVYRRD